MAQILIIDNDPTVSEILRLILSHEVQAVTDGQAGIDLIHDMDADLAIVDIFIPQKSGLEIIQGVTRRKPDVKLIAMTAFGAQDDIEMRGFAERFGAIQSFEKPFDNGEVIKAVHEALKN